VSRLIFLFFVFFSFGVFGITKQRYQYLRNYKGGDQSYYLLMTDEFQNGEASTTSVGEVMTQIIRNQEGRFGETVDWKALSANRKKILKKEVYVPKYIMTLNGVGITP
jgi:hypothetical protein